MEDYRTMGLDRAAGAFVTDDQAEGELFVEARRIGFPAIEARGSLFLEDVGAPVPLLPDLLASIAEVAASYDVAIPVVAHAGDGNTHPIIVYDAGDPDSEKRAREAFAQVMARAIELGGTITGEHGVGRPKKQALPDGILNRGAVL